VKQPQPIGGPAASAGAWTLVTADGAPLSEIRLPQPFYERYKDPEGYMPGDDLIAAVNVALLLGQPLLLTGEPGSGKTSLAAWLSRQLGLGDPLTCTVKSTTSGTDLLYRFDELARFRDAQPGGAPRAQQDYLELNALGRAILFSAGPGSPLQGAETARSRGAVATASGQGDVVEGYAAPVGPPHRALTKHADIYQGEFPAKRRCVVLIDELDKAPLDTPNDLLNEIERMTFRIPELGVNVAGDPAHRPVVIITSNSDKSLPTPFLRRCVYFDIPPPSDERLEEIVLRRNGGLATRPVLFKEALAIYRLLRGRLDPKPGTAEFLAWLQILDERLPADPLLASLHSREAAPALKSSLGALVKTQDQLAEAQRSLDTHDD
jgi:MoxR-like ATPase